MSLHHLVVLAAVASLHAAYRSLQLSPLPSYCYRGIYKKSGSLNLKRLSPACAAYGLTSLVNATRPQVFNFLLRHAITPQFPLQTSGGAYSPNGSAAASAYLAYTAPNSKSWRKNGLLYRGRAFNLVLGDPKKLTSRLGRRPSQAFSIWTLGQTTFTQNVKDLKASGTSYNLDSSMYLDIPAIPTYAWTDSNPLLLIANSTGNSSLIYSVVCNPKNQSEALSIRMAVVNPGSNDPVEVETYLAANATIGPTKSSLRVIGFTPDNTTTTQFIGVWSTELHVMNIFAVTLVKVGQDISNTFIPRTVFGPYLVHDCST